ncbi:MAG: dephospho-CoA kinase [Clostridia bacterium]|nr:dephospho-CoA kinase [Clostridia bacterium]
MKLILITGKTGSGKNKLGDYLCLKNNFKHIDIDKICHTCYENQKIVEKVKFYFGNDIIENNQVNRKKLGAIVFNDKEKMKILSDLTYNFVIEKIDEIIANSTTDIVLNYVLLPNTKYWNQQCFKILVKSDSDDERYKHLVERDKVSMEYILSRDKNSLTYYDQDFDYVFVNDYKEKTLQENVDKIIKLIAEK